MLMQDKAELTRILGSAVSACNMPLVEVLMSECNKQTGPWLKTLAVHHLVDKAPIDLLDSLLSAGASCNQRDPKTGEGPVHKV